MPMMSQMCLNHNAPEVKLWLKNMSKDDVYREYVKNGYFLPDWEDYNKVKGIKIPLAIADKYVNSMIPSSAYEYKNIGNIGFKLPLNAKAAFWKDTFYFNDQVTRGEIGEETFHALYQTIFSKDERALLNSVAAKQINVEQKVEEYLVKQPTIYKPLSKQDRIDRVLEETIANEFSNWYQYNLNNKTTRNKEIDRLAKKLNISQGVATLVSDFFEFIKSLFGFGNKDRNYLESLYQSIQNGEFKFARVVLQNNETPSLYTVEYTNNSGVTQRVSESESSMIVNSIVGTYFRDKFETVLEPAELLNEVLNTFRERYLQFKPELATLFTPTIETTDDNFDLIEIPNPLYEELKSEILKRIIVQDKFRYDAIDEDQGDSVTDENSPEMSYSDSTSANEAGFEGFSSFLKQYFTTIGRKVEFTDISGNDLSIVEVVDSARLYYGVARALNNTSSDIERLYKLVQYSEIEDNVAAKAFIETFARDLTGSTSSEFINKIKDAYQIYSLNRENYGTEEYNPKLDSRLLNQVIKIVDKEGNDTYKRSHILQNVLKGLDLWTRNPYINLVSPETGYTETILANANNAVRTQIESWRGAYDYAERNKSKIELIQPLVDIVGLTSSQISNALLTAANENQSLFKSQLGINLSIGTLEWLLINKTGVNKFSAEKQKFYNTWLQSITEIKENYVIEDILVKFSGLKDEGLTSLQDVQDNIDQEDSKLFTLFSFAKADVKKLAEINAIFDESVFESSYKNAENKSIFSFQAKTFNLEFIKNLQDAKTIESLLNNGLIEYKDGVFLTEHQDFIRNNRILSAMTKKGADDKYRINKESIFAKLLPLMKGFSTDGLRQTAKNDLGREGNGVTFSNMLTKDFDIFRLNQYFNTVKPYTIEGETFYLYAHYIGNLEAKRTADFVYMPEVTNVIEGGKVSNSALKLLKNEIKKEYDRIQRVHNQIKELVENPDNEFNFGESNTLELTATNLYGKLKQGEKNQDIIDSYHTGVIERVENEDGTYHYKSYVDKKGKFGGLRSLEFTDVITGNLKSEDILKLKNFALMNQSFNVGWSYDKQLSDQWDVIFNEHIKRVDTEDYLIGLDAQWKSKNEKTKKESLKTELFKSFVLSNYLNTLSFNQIQHGDNALLFKNGGNGIDFVKRAGGKNASGNALDSYLIKPEWGINNPFTKIKFAVGNEIVSRVAFDTKHTLDQADAQNFTSTTYKRNLLWSQGNLTAFSAYLLDKIDMGYPLSKADKDAMYERDEFLNVDKTVGYNGSFYLKKGDMMLTKELTSRLKQDVQNRLFSLENQARRLTGEEKTNKLLEIKNIRLNENNWEARPNNTDSFLHNLRQSMDGWRESEEGLLQRNVDEDGEFTNSYSLWMPKSASKMFNINIHNLSADPTLKNIDNSIVQMSARDYVLQLQNPAGKERIYDMTQMIEIIFNELDSEEMVQHRGEIQNLGALEILYNKLLADRTKSLYMFARNDIFDENGEFVSKAFFEKAMINLINSGADPQTVSAMRLDKDGKPITNPNIGIIKDKFRDLYFSHFTNEVLKQKQAGDAVAHVTSFGFEQLKRVVIYQDENGNAVPTWETVITDSDEYNRVANNRQYIKLNLEKEDLAKPESERQVIYDPSQEMDVLRRKLIELGDGAYFVDELRFIVPRYNIKEDGTVDSKPIAYYTETLLPMWKQFDEVNDMIRYMFATRIPSQDKHSAVNIQLVNALPSYYANTVMMAKEIVFISGSDFDIDKLFYLRPETYEYKGEVYKYGDEIAVKDKDGNIDKDASRWLEYMIFVKEYHISYARDIKELRTNSAESQLIKILKETKKGLIESAKPISQNIKQIEKNISNTKREKEKLQHIQLLEINQAELSTVNKRIRGISDQLDEAQDVLSGNAALLLKSLRLPSTIEELNKSGFFVDEKGVYNLPLAVNNELLELRQIALTNDSTLKDQLIKKENNLLVESNIELTNEQLEDLSKKPKNKATTTKAIYKTGATQDALQNLMRDSYYTNEEGEQIPMFRMTEKNEDGSEGDIEINLFGNKLLIPLHTFLEHSNAHRNTTVGKKNIGPAVNAILAMINVIKGNLQIGMYHQVTINGYQATGFKTISEDNQRMFDLLSTLVSAATDEAKDQQNATYNITLEGISILRVMIGMGFSMQTSIALLNQPVNVRYFQELDNKKKTIFLESQFESDEELLARLGRSKEPFAYNDELLSRSLKGEYIEGLRGAVLNDLIKFQDISKHLDHLTRFIKLKKGFDGGFVQLDNLMDSIDVLGFYKMSEEQYAKFKIKSPIDTHLIYAKKDPLFKVMWYYVDSIVRDQYNITQKLFLEVNSEVRVLKKGVQKHLKNLSNLDKEKFDKSFLSYLHVRLYLNQITSAEKANLVPSLFVNGENTLAKRLIALKKEVKKIKKKVSAGESLTQDELLLSTLSGTSLFTRINVSLNETKNSVDKKKGFDVLNLNTFGSLSPEQLDDMLTSFDNIMSTTKLLSNDYADVRNIPEDLFNYYVLKDAFQFKSGSISKLFQMYMFTDHSKSIEQYLRNPRSFLGTDIDNYRIVEKEYLDRIALNKENNNLFKNFNTKFQPKIPFYSNNYDNSIERSVVNIDFKKLFQNDQEDLAKSLNNAPYQARQEKGVYSLTFIPHYIKTIIKDQVYGDIITILRLESVYNGFGKKTKHTDPDFVESLQRDIIFAQYRSVNQNANTFQSEFTQDLNYTDLNSIVRKVSIKNNEKFDPYTIVENDSELAEFKRLEQSNKSTENLVNDDMKFSNLTNEEITELSNKNNSQVNSFETVSNKLTNYKGGFENTGKGTPQGDGKDKAMREVSQGAIVELSKITPSSSLTSLKSYPSLNEDGKTKWSVSNEAVAPNIIMLARNGSLSGQPLSETTKNVIKTFYNEGTEFVVGDMPNVDSQFIDYLQEIGATFTIYHTGNKSRIESKQSKNNSQDNSSETVSNKPNLQNQSVIWNNLSDDNQFGLNKVGITKEEFDDMSENNKLKAIECYGTKK